AYSALAWGRCSYLAACEGPSGLGFSRAGLGGRLDPVSATVCGRAHLRSELVRDPEPSAALGSNVLGALAGGVMEYSSMAFGFRAIYLIALGLYVSSYLSLARAGRASA